MKNKIRLFIGWFGVLTPVYAAGILTVMLSIGGFDSSIIIRVVVVSVVNFFVGLTILRAKIAVKEDKKHARTTT